jgi:carbon storage regulator
MLVLSRKTDEQIVIGGEIRVTVLRVKGDRVKLGIQAGDDLKIMRGELLDRTVDAKIVATAEPHSTIADPTIGLGDEDSPEDNTAHPAGARENVLEPSWSSSRPAWLTICCCS